MKYNTKNSQYYKRQYKSQKEWIMRRLYTYYKDFLRTKVSKEEKENFMIKIMEFYWTENIITINMMSALKLCQCMWFQQ